MMFDLAVVLAYFLTIMGVGFLRRMSREVNPEEYFLSSRSLRWPAVAVSTLATNISAGHFLGVTGAAYLYGLAQGNFELNAVFGILIAAFLFLPLYLRMKVMTITQFFEARFGARIALIYSVLMLVLYGFIYLGSALFWGAYAVNAVFADVIVVFHPNPAVRIVLIMVGLGLFSAAYTYMGGMRAVVRTDMIQFGLLLVGGLIVTWLAVNQLGSWSRLFEETGHLWHLHLPTDHDVLPWTALFAMMLLNLNYWGANQVILQRALAAKSLKHAQIGLLVGGLLKYLMVLILIVPGIALAGILVDRPLSDPDEAFPTLVQMLLPAGVRGIVLCGLFASLMSTIDSIFHSVSTLWSIDLYKRWLRPHASDMQIVQTGKRAIFVTLLTGLTFGMINVYVKLGDPTLALAHWFNDISFYVKNIFVLMIVSAVFLVKPSRTLIVTALVLSIPLNLVIKYVVPSMLSGMDPANAGYGEMNYLNRAGLVIVITFLFVAIPTIIRNGWRIGLREMVDCSSYRVGIFGVILGVSLVLCHIVLH